jgi:hypothetical protein
MTSPAVSTPNTPSASLPHTDALPATACHNCGVAKQNVNTRLRRMRAQVRLRPLLFPAVPAVMTVLAGLVPAGAAESMETDPRCSTGPWLYLTHEERHLPHEEPPRSVRKI